MRTAVLQVVVSCALSVRLKSARRNAGIFAPVRTGTICGEM